MHVPGFRLLVAIVRIVKPVEGFADAKDAEEQWVKRRYVVDGRRNTFDKEVEPPSARN